MSKLDRSISAQDGVLITDTPISVASAYPWRYTLGSEVIYVTGASGTLLSANRGGDDTTAVAHAKGTALVAAPIPTTSGGGSQTPWASDIDAAGFGLHGLADPASPQDAATQASVAAAVGAIDLSTVLGVGNGANAKIVSLTDPTDPQDAVTKAYVDAALAALPRWLDLGVVNVVDLLAGPVALYTTTGAQEILGVFYAPAGRVSPPASTNIIFTTDPTTADELVHQWFAAYFGAWQDTPNEALSDLAHFGTWPIEGGTLYAVILNNVGFSGFIRGPWQANHVYAGDSANNNSDQVTGAGHIWYASNPGGTSGGSAPDFAGNIGGSVTDNDITWTDVGAVPTVGSVGLRALVATPLAP